MSVYAVFSFSAFSSSWDHSCGTVSQSVISSQTRNPIITIVMHIYLLLDYMPCLFVCRNNNIVISLAVIMIITLYSKV